MTATGIGTDALVTAILQTADADNDGSLAAVNLSGVKEFMLRVVSEDGQRLQHASAALKDDREVVMAACNQNG